MICRIILTRFSVFYVAKIWLVAPSHGLLRLSAPFTFSLHPLRERRRRRQPPANGSPCAVYDVSIFQPAHAGLRELINILLRDVLATLSPSLCGLFCVLCVRACVFVCRVLACLCVVCLRVCVLCARVYVCCVLACCGWNVACVLCVRVVRCVVYCVLCVLCVLCLLCTVFCGCWVVCCVFGVCIVCLVCVVCWAYEYVCLFVRAF